MRTKVVFALAIFLVGVGSPVWASDGEDKDNYRLRVEAAWWNIHPQGDFGARSSNNYINFNEDFHFGDHSTFIGAIDWRFHRKHHFLLLASPTRFSRTVTANRTIDFQGQTFDIGTQVQLKLKAFNFAPGYQYDVIRRDWGYVGLQVNINLLDTGATLNSTRTVNGQTVARTASKSVLAPLPAGGPVFRVYPLRRLSLEGAATGMYFFGYGSFATARADIGVGIWRGLTLRGGYQMGSRLSIHGASNQIGLRLTTTGPTAGLEYSWGEFPAERPHPAISPELSNWNVDWIPLYFWFTGVSGYVGLGGGVVSVHESVSDVFSQLNVAVMSLLDVRHKRLGLLTDLVYVSLSTDEKTTPFQTLYTGYSTKGKSFFLDPEIYGRVVDTKRLSVDALAGARIWHLDNAIDLYQGTTATVTAGQTQNWVDPVLGGRFRLNLDKGWYATLKGDAGGFGAGSQETYQTYAGIARDFKNKYSLLVGYRYFSVDYKNGGFLYDVHQNGPILGLNIHFLRQASAQ